MSSQPRDAGSAVPPEGGSSPSEERCLAATQQLDKLHQAVLEDLDPTNGGISWWHGHVDWRRNCLMADYLLSATQGTSSSLRYAALCIAQHNEKCFADGHWVSSTVAQGQRQRLPPAAVLRRGPYERDRQAIIEMTRQHVVFHLAQGLDQLAAATALVLGLAAGNIAYFDWAKLRGVAEKAAKQATPTGPKQALEMKLLSPGSDGRRLQDQVLTRVLQGHESAPEQWLDWLMIYRNSVTHRPRPVSWYLTHSTQGRMDGIVAPLPKQPDWPQVRAMVESSRTRPQDMFLEKDPGTQLTGLFESVISLVVEVAGQLEDVWEQRRSHPEWIVQHGGAWPELGTEKELGFAGYGPVDPGLSSKRDYVVVSPDLQRRLAGVRMDGRGLALWSQTDF